MVTIIASTLEVEYRTSNNHPVYIYTYLGMSNMCRISEAAVEGLGLMDYVVRPAYVGMDHLMVAGHITLPVIIDNNTFHILFQVIESRPFDSFAYLSRDFIITANIKICTARRTFVVRNGSELPLVLCWEEPCHEPLLPFPVHLRGPERGMGQVRLELPQIIIAKKKPL